MRKRDFVDKDFENIRSMHLYAVIITLYGTIGVCVMNDCLDNAMIVGIYSKPN